MIIWGKSANQYCLTRWYIVYFQSDRTKLLPCLSVSLDCIKYSWHLLTLKTTNISPALISSWKKVLSPPLLLGKQGCCLKLRWRRENQCELMPSLLWPVDPHLVLVKESAMLYFIDFIYLCVCNNTPIVYYCLGSSAASCLLLSPRHFICPVTECVLCVSEYFCVCGSWYSIGPQLPLFFIVVFWQYLFCESVCVFSYAGNRLTREGRKSMFDRWRKTRPKLRMRLESFFFFFLNLNQVWN